MRTPPLLLPLLVSLAGCRTPAPPAPQATPTAAAPAVPSADAQLTQLVEANFEARLALAPTLATSIGDNRFNHLYADDLSDAHRARMLALLEEGLAQARAIDVRGLSEQGRLTHTLFVRGLELELEGRRFPQHLLPLNQFSSAPSGFAQMGAGGGLHPFKTTKDYEDFLGRVDGFLAWNASAIERLREGVRTGVVLPRVVVERTLPQLAAHVVARPEDSLFWGPVAHFPETVPEADRPRLTAAYRAAIEGKLVPAYRRLHDFLRDEYLPHARSSVGLGALPGGDAWYAHLVRRFTTTGLTPEALHALGLSEVARIQGQIDALMREVGFAGDRAAFNRHVMGLEALRYKSREDMLERHRAFKERVDGLTPRLFSLIPRQTYEVRAVEAFREKSASIGSYQVATADGSRPGIFYVNTRDWAEVPATTLEALTLHEGAPGHHFQLSVQRSLASLPRFRRFGGYTAYAEGWGLYAETLGTELGVYTDPYQRYGALSEELWRAVRLVLDTGLHARGWTREAAITYGRQNGTRSEQQVVAEVERFIAIPGQALAYKVGQLKISELRARAQKALGPRFDVKAFHREVLEDGALPLDVLSEKLDAWIAREAAH